MSSKEVRIKDGYLDFSHDLYPESAIAEFREDPVLAARTISLATMELDLIAETDSAREGSLHGSIAAQSRAEVQTVWEQHHADNHGDDPEEFLRIYRHERG